jgi:quinol monooxygenase YgiN
MTFHAEKVEAFKEIFLSSKDRIAAFPGCHHVWLLRDPAKENVFHTWSIWEEPEDLERYRHSELFSQVWGKTKVLFSDKPAALSYPIETF